MTVTVSIEELQTYEDRMRRHYGSLLSQCKGRIQLSQDEATSQRVAHAQFDVVLFAKLDRDYPPPTLLPPVIRQNHIDMRTSSEALQR